MYRVAVTPADAGSRVTLRRAVPEGVSDVVGTLLSWSGGVLRVERRDGSVVEVPEGDVVASRVVPPAQERPARRAPAGPEGPPGPPPVPPAGP